MSIFSTIWDELSRPSTGDNWYAWASIALGHVMVGALIITGIDYFLTLDGPGRESARVLGAVGYAVIKEVPDIQKGGLGWDSLADVCFVFLGTFYGAIWMPIAAFVAVFVGVAAIISKKLL